jgi:archaellum component FlaC
LAGSSKGYATRGTELTSPKSFEEVEERLNQIYADLNNVDQAARNREKELRETLGEEIAGVREQGEQIRKEAQDQATAAFEARRTEATIFTFGVFVQVIGAFLLAFC